MLHNYLTACNSNCTNFIFSIFGPDFQFVNCDFSLYVASIKKMADAKLDNISIMLLYISVFNISVISMSYFENSLRFWYIFSQKCCQGNTPCCQGNTGVLSDKPAAGKHARLNKVLHVNITV